MYLLVKGSDIIFDSQIDTVTVQWLQSACDDFNDFHGLKHTVYEKSWNITSIEIYFYALFWLIYGALTHDTKYSFPFEHVDTWFGE